MTVIAFDPGYDRLGWAVGKVISGKLQVTSYGCIRTDKNLKLFSRYEIIINELNKLIKKYQPTQAAIESLFFFSNQKTALKVAEVRGIIFSCLIQKNISIVEYTPLQIKQAVTGYGRADKKAVEKMVRLQLQIPTSEKLIDDTLDALGVLFTFSIRSQSKLE